MPLSSALRMLKGNIVVLEVVAAQPVINPLLV